METTSQTSVATTSASAPGIREASGISTRAKLSIPQAPNTAPDKSLRLASLPSRFSRRVTAAGKIVGNANKMPPASGLTATATVADMTDMVPPNTKRNAIAFHDP